jgi:hypothetical protein
VNVEAIHLPNSTQQRSNIMNRTENPHGQKLSRQVAAAILGVSLIAAPLSAAMAGTDASLPAAELVSAGEARGQVREHLRDLGYVNAHASRIFGVDVARPELTQSGTAWAVEVTFVTGLQREKGTVFVDRITGEMSADEPGSDLARLPFKVGAKS